MMFPPRIFAVGLSYLLTAVHLSGAATEDAPHVKTKSLLVTAEMRRNAKANLERFDWAEGELAALKKKVAPWQQLTLEELWRLLPSQELPRAHWADRGNQGCPNCGKKIHDLPARQNRGYGIKGDAWIFDPFQHPWKIECPACGERFPRNDFAAYYASSLDRTGKFRSGRGDKKHLTAGKSDPLGRFVDEGHGVRANGQSWFPVAHYAFLLWAEVVQMTEDLAKLYTLTGDAAYARRAGVLLHRMADLYPEMDFQPFYKMGMEASSGGSGRGKVIGCIWENFLAESMTRAYDMIFDAIAEDAELASFLASLPGEKRPSNPIEVVRWIETGLIAEIPKAVLNGDIRGNQGMYQKSMALAAVVLDRGEQTRQWLEWIFAPKGGDLSTVLQQTLSREGLGNEAGVSYSLIPVKEFWSLLDILKGNGEAGQQALLNTYPKVKASYTSMASIRLLDAVTLPVGDSFYTQRYMTQRIWQRTLMEGYRALGGDELARGNLVHKPRNF